MININKIAYLDIQFKLNYKLQAFFNKKNIKIDKKLLLPII